MTLHGVADTCSALVEGVGAWKSIVRFFAAAKHTGKMEIKSVLPN